MKKVILGLFLATAIVSCSTDNKNESTKKTEIEQNALKNEISANFLSPAEMEQLKFNYSNVSNATNNTSKKNVETIENEHFITEQLDLMLDKANKQIYKKLKSTYKGEDYAGAIISITHNKETKTFSVSKIDASPIVPIDFSVKYDTKASKEYEVVCSGGKYDGNKTICNGKFSCGTALYKCLEGGECGTICTANVEMEFPL